MFLAVVNIQDLSTTVLCYHRFAHQHDCISCPCTQCLDPVSLLMLTSKGFKRTESLWLVHKRRFGDSYPSFEPHKLGGQTIAFVTILRFCSLISLINSRSCSHFPDIQRQCSSPCSNPAKEGGCNDLGLPRTLTFKGLAPEKLLPPSHSLP